MRKSKEIPSTRSVLDFLNSHEKYLEGRENGLTIESFQEDILKPAMTTLSDVLHKTLVEGYAQLVKEKPEVIQQFRKLDDGTIIDHCYHNCPYFKLEGGPGPVMYCSHPETSKNYTEEYGDYIISHPDCDTGFPEKCPLPVVTKYNQKGK